MSDDNIVELTSVEDPDDLKPKPPPRLAPRGITTFTVCRQSDETGVSGEGVVIEGVSLASGHCVIHWLFPPPRGGIAIFDFTRRFLKGARKTSPYQQNHYYV